MTTRFFLWPESRSLSMADLLGPPVLSEDIEAKLRTIFPHSDPVLFSSARAGLTAVLQNLGLSRPDVMWTPPYSSHCVLEAVAHVCTPTPVVTGMDGISAALVYHQWGHIHKSSFPQSVIIVEDSVDSLLIPGTFPFANDGDFALWSLPKVLGTQSGGVVFCRDAESATVLRALRDSRTSSVLQAFLRWRSKSSALAATYWNGAEALQGRLVMLLRRQVLHRLNAIDQVTEERLSILRNISLDLSHSYEGSGRLPSNLPMRMPSEWRRVWGPDGPVSSGIRSFNVARTSPDMNWLRVVPLPVHVDVSQAHLKEIFQRLNLKVQSNEFEIV